MIIYKFYLIPDDKINNVNDVRIEDKYPLYAITAVKKFYKMFKKYRNMDKFIVIKTEVDDDEVSEILNKHIGNVLDIRSYASKTKNYEYEEIGVLSTYLEYSESSQALDMIAGLTFTHPKIFEKKYRDALRSLEYEGHAYLYLADDDNEDYFNYDYPALIADEFTMFIHQTEDLFRKD